jgi:hypothetical protein
MGADLCALVRRDHDDLDGALGAMVNPATPPKELSNLLDIFLLALAVHIATETRVFSTLVQRVSGPRTLALIAEQCRQEHVEQRTAAEAMMTLRPGSIAWYESALELRVLVLDHSARGDYARYTLEDHVPLDIQRTLAREYAVERMRVLASTSPIREAQLRMAAFA